MMNLQGKFKSSLLPVMIIFGLLLAVYVIAGVSDASWGTSAKFNATNLSVVGKVVGTGAGTQNAGQSFMIGWINVSGTMFFNLSMNASNGTAAGLQSWNVTNVSIMFRHNQNESVMGNFTATNSTVAPNGIGLGNVGPVHWNISVDTTTMPDGVYRIFAIVGNFTTSGAVGTGTTPVTNATLATNVTIDNSPPNVTIPADTAASRNFTRSQTSAVDSNQSFNASVQDSSFWYLHGTGQPNGSNVANVTFSFNNASDNGFNITIDFGSGATSAVTSSSSNMSSANTSAVVWQVMTNITTFHAGEHTVRVYATNYNGMLNSTTTFNFTINTPHNVTIMSSNTGEVVTQFANYSGRNTSLMFNISVINATGLLRAGYAGAPAAPPPIFTVIAMFDNASGNDFNLSNGSNRVSDLNIAGVGYWNLSYNVSALTEGNHTVTFFVNDTHGNHNKTQSISFFVDKTAPSLTITCTPSEPKEGETVSCTCSASDSGTGLRSDAAFIGGTKSQSTVASGIGQHDTSECSAEDYSFNRNTKKGSYSVVSAASGGSGGGGAGGGSSSSIGTSGVKHVWASINAGEVAKIVADKPGLAVTAVEVKVDQTIYGAWVQVKSVEKADLPSAASSKLAGKVYDLIEISDNKIAFKEAVVSERTVNFKVEKSWLSQNGLDKSDVALLRYNNNEWVALPTTVGSEDALAVEYKATTPGFSFFAVGEKSAATAVAPSPSAEGTQPTPTPAPTTAPTAPSSGTAMEKEGGSSTWLWVVLVLVVIGAAVYFVNKRK